MAQRMVLAGLGVGCLLPSTVADELQAGRLVRLMPDLQGRLCSFRWCIRHGGRCRYAPVV
ncbi:hypothetical protein [Aliamphritea spongicola]|nr:hypothetical protein [Aliamphritea spongicola]